MHNSCARQKTEPQVQQSLLLLNLELSFENNEKFKDKPLT